MVALVLVAVLAGSCSGGGDTGTASSPTELAGMIIGLDFARHVGNPPRGKVHVLSTLDEVALDDPVVLDVPRPEGTVTVSQPVDGEWIVVDVQDGETVRVPITGFSTVPTAVIGADDAPPEALEDAPQGLTDAEFLGTCLVMLSTMLGSGDIDDPESSGVNWAAALCTRALIDRSTPAGRRVEVGCVGDKIGDAVDLRQAIDACIAEGDDGTTSTDAPIVTDPVESVPDPSGDVAFVVLLPLGSESCNPGEVTSVEQATLSFFADRTLDVAGSVTCLSDGETYVATLSGQGTWDPDAGTYQVTATFGSDALGYTKAPLAGTIDLAGRTIDFNSDVLPFVPPDSDR